MPEPERTSAHRHRHRHKRRSSGSSKRGAKLRLIDYFLMAWSVASLVAFFYLIDKVETAPVWQLVGLAVSTLVGLILFFKLAMRTKK